jgi:hypothetical protein
VSDAAEDERVLLERVAAADVAMLRSVTDLELASMWLTRSKQFGVRSPWTVRVGDQIQRRERGR